jgi:hypothetical protein
LKKQSNFTSHRRSDHLALLPDSGSVSAGVLVGIGGIHVGIEQCVLPSQGGHAHREALPPHAHLALARVPSSDGGDHDEVAEYPFKFLSPSPPLWVEYPKFTLGYNELFWPKKLFPSARPVPMFAILIILRF